MAIGGDYVLLFPVDAPGLNEPRYGHVIALAGADVSVVDVEDPMIRCLNTMGNNASKFAFRPTSRQIAVNELLAAPPEAGTPLDEFIDNLIPRRAVQFAPHPGVLIRLYDFQFGTRGLSIMQFCFMARVSKMTWVKLRKTNMQNFSRSVVLPEATTPSSVDDISAAVRVLQTYCATFMTPEVGDLVRSLHAFVHGLGA
ncbi:hypothetical protein PHPALM_28063 [Phytophthora palmivora]|uniref:Uncharacterized protein n=1 Tax=Phytophthora palmivora TaxID=4796 RepID=A0A2P4XB07_9STRA|nr:hypothetical protein PHPALM_28063 [Phytophthora palmivora]